MNKKVNMSSISNKIHFIYGDECEKNKVGIIIFNKDGKFFFDSEFKNEMTNDEVEAVLLRGAVVNKNGKYYRPSSFDNEKVSFNDTTIESGSSEGSRVLEGKTFICIGDSFVMGHTLTETQTWAYKLANRNNMSYYKHAVNGASLTYKEGQSPTALINSIDSFLSGVSAADYVIVLVGHNDANPDLNGGSAIPIGKNTDKVNTTFKGALNLLIDKFYAKYPTAKILFLTPFNRRGIEEPYVEAMKEICGIWCIPCFDNYHSGGICFQNAAQAAKYELGTSRHLNELGQERVSYLYESLLKNELPISYSLGVTSKDNQVGSDLTFYTFEDTWELYNSNIRATIWTNLQTGDIVSFKEDASWDTYKFAISLDNNNVSSGWINGGYQTEAYTVTSSVNHTIMVARLDNGQITTDEIAEIIGYFR